MAISEARYRANKKYNEKTYERVAFDVKKGERDMLKAYAERQGMSLNNFVGSCISYCIHHKIDVSAVPALTETLPEDVEPL